MVILDKVDLAADCFLETVLTEALKEEAAIVTEHTRLDAEDFGNGEGNNVH